MRAHNVRVPSARQPKTAATNAYGHTAGDRIRVVIAEDEAFICECFRELLELEPDIEVVGTALDGGQAVRLTQEQRPDLLVLDLKLPKLHGVEVAKAVRADVPETRIVVLTAYASPQTARTLVDLGVRGLFSKTAAVSSIGEFADALRTVHQGDEYFHPAVARLLVTRPVAKAHPTAREMEVLRLVAEGLRDRDIAQRLSIGERTVHFHLRNLRRKFGAASRVQILRAARDQEWIL